VHTVAVVKVTCNDDEGDLFPESQGYQVLEGLSCSLTKLFHRGSFIKVKPMQRAVQVYVRSVNELKHHNPMGSQMDRLLGRGLK